MVAGHYNIEQILERGILAVGKVGGNLLFGVV